MQAKDRRGKQWAAWDSSLLARPDSLCTLPALLYAQEADLCSCPWAPWPPSFQLGLFNGRYWQDIGGSKKGDVGGFPPALFLPELRELAMFF